MELGAVAWALASFISGIGALWAAWTGLRKLRADARAKGLADCLDDLQAAQEEARALMVELHHERMRELDP